MNLSWTRGTRLIVFLNTDCLCKYNRCLHTSVSLHAIWQSRMGTMAGQICSKLDYNLDSVLSTWLLFSACACVRMRVCVRACVCVFCSNSFIQISFLSKYYHMYIYLYTKTCELMTSTMNYMRFLLVSRLSK